MSTTEPTINTQETTSQLSEAATGESVEVQTERDAISAFTTEPTGVTEETTSQASDELTTENERNATEKITIVPTKVIFMEETTPQIIRNSIVDN